MQKLRPVPIDLVTPKEAARSIGMTRQGVNWHLNNGNLPYYDFGNDPTVRLVSLADAQSLKEHGTGKKLGPPIRAERKKDK